MGSSALAFGACRLAMLCLMITSTGCLQYRDCTSAEVTPGVRGCLLEHDGLERSYVLYIPDSYDPAVATPVVFDFHGRGGRASAQHRVSSVRPVADREGFLVVAPQGYEKSWNAGGCCGDAYDAAIDDVGFVAAVLDDLSAYANVDADRVFAMGLSNGGRMSLTVGCELADRFAAVASVAATLSIDDPTTGTRVYPCAPTRGVPVFLVHGTGDECTPYAGGDGMDTSNNVSLSDTVAHFSVLAGCQSTGSFLESGSTSCTVESGCNDGAEVVLCTVEGGGHIWPGNDPYLGWRICGGEWIDDIETTEELWSFFAAHPWQGP